SDQRLGIVRVAHLQLAGALGEALDERFVELLLDDETVGDHADLALVQELAEKRSVHCKLEVRIAEHHERRIAAELEIDTLHDGRLHGLPRHAAPYWCRAGKGDDARGGMAHEGIAD